MPIFIVRNSKATPGDAIEYITRSGKAAYVSVKNLMGGSDLSKQIMDTMKDFGKGDGYNERKYYHCKLSPSRAEIISLEDMHRYAEEMAEAVFDPDMQIVIATHFDSGNPHSHIIVGAMNPVTGKKLHYTMRDFAYMKDTANEIGLEYGLSPVDFRERSNTRVKQGELYARKTSKPTTKDLLRETICDAISVCVSEQEFLEYIKAQGIEITRSKTEYSYLYPGAKRAVRGDTLGEMFKKENILKAMFEMENEEYQYDDSYWDPAWDDEEDMTPDDGEPMTEHERRELENWIADTRKELNMPESEEQSLIPVAESGGTQPAEEESTSPYDDIQLTEEQRAEMEKWFADAEKELNKQQAERHNFPTVEDDTTMNDTQPAEEKSTSPYDDIYPTEEDRIETERWFAEAEKELNEQQAERHDSPTVEDDTMMNDAQPAEEESTSPYDDIYPTEEDRIETERWFAEAEKELNEQQAEHDDSPVSETMATEDSNVQPDGGKLMAIHDDEQPAEEKTGETENSPLDAAKKRNEPGLVTDTSNVAENEAMDAGTSQPREEDHSKSLTEDNEKRPNVISEGLDKHDTPSFHSDASVAAQRPAQSTHRSAVGIRLTDVRTDFEKWKKEKEQEWNKQKDEATRKHRKRISAIDCGPAYRHDVDTDEENQRYYDEMREIYQKQVDESKEWIATHTDQDVNKVNSTIARVIVRPSKNTTRDGYSAAGSSARNSYSAWQNPENNPKPRHDDYDDKFLSK